MSRATLIWAATTMSVYRMVLPTALRKIGSRARVTKLSKPTNVPPTIVAVWSDRTNACTTGMSVNRAKKASVGRMKMYDHACFLTNETKLRVGGTGGGGPHAPPTRTRTSSEIIYSPRRAAPGLGAQPRPGL